MQRSPRAKSVVQTADAVKLAEEGAVAPLGWTGYSRLPEMGLARLEVLGARWCL